MFNRLFKTDQSHQQKALEFYQECIEQARRAKFYTEMGVPDSFDGRFEMIVLHVCLKIMELQTLEENTTKIEQAMFDIMFADMDQSLRERGIGDHSFPKHMKRMMKGFNGRAHAYKQALDGKDKTALKDALRRNVYGTLKDDKIETQKMDLLVGYVEGRYKRG